MSLNPFSSPEAPENIFKSLRLASGLSHDALAKQMNTTKRALIWLEQGTYDRPLPVALTYWLGPGQFLPGIKHSGIRVTELTLIEGYESFKEQTRDQNRLYFGPSISHLSYSAGAPHPFLQLKDAAGAVGNDNSSNALAKSLCIPQATLNLWERKWRTQHSVPKTFQSVLLAIGYTRFEVRSLITGYETWRVANK